MSIGVHKSSAMKLKSPAVITVMRKKPSRALRVAGFNHDAVQVAAMQCVHLGYLPVATEYTQMEHKVTGARGIYMEVTFNPS